MEILKRKIAFIILAASACLSAALGDNETAQKQPALYDYCGTNIIKEVDPELDGTGINIQAVFRSKTYVDSYPQKDYKVNNSHNCFNTSQIKYANSQDAHLDGISDHATAIAGLLAGYDSHAYNPVLGDFEYEGAAPKSQVLAVEFWDFLVDYAFPAQKARDADLMTMSIGTSVPDWWTRALDSIAQKEGILIIAGIGNGGDVLDPPLYPAAGPNVLGVGVVDCIANGSPIDTLSSYWLAQKEHSSMGPTSDGRCKPDITAPANALVPSSEDENSYVLCGDYSSFAAPIVAGTTALLIQKAQLLGYSDLFSDENSNCLLKSILMTSAQKPAYWHKGNWTNEDDHLRPLDYIHGSGIIDAENAYELLVSGHKLPDSNSISGWDKNQINGINENSYFVTPPDSNEVTHLQITLNWNKHFSRKYPFNEQESQDIDLRLELWAKHADSDTIELVDYSDSTVDNVEHIYWKNEPGITEYEIVVLFSDRERVDKTDLNQPYAISWMFDEYNPADDISWYDLNGDNVLDDGDIAILINRMGELKQEDPTHRGDLNFDGIIDLKDLRLMKMEFQQPANQ